MDPPDSLIDGDMLIQMCDETFPREDRAILLSILYGGTRRELPSDITIMFFLNTLLHSESGVTSKTYLNQANCLVEFLKNGGDHQKVTDFHTLAKNKLRYDGWPVALSDSAKEWDCTWRMIYMMLGFQGVPKHFNPTFSIMAETFFGKSESRSPTRIGFSLDDLMNVDLKIQPTDFLHEHLELLRDGTVKVFRMSKSSTLAMLLDYSTNKIAEALGIGSLGNEILCSYNALTGNRDVPDPTHYRAIMEPIHDIGELQLAMKSQQARDVELLSQRVIALQHEINSRKRWWNSLKRDLNKQSDVQRLMFYGAVLAASIGILSTVVAVVAKSTPSVTHY